MGFALAGVLVAEGADVTLVGRSPARLALARDALERDARDRGADASSRQAVVHTVAADIGRDADVAALFAEIGQVEHVVVTAADATGVYGRSGDIAVGAARAALDTKLIGAWLVGRYAAGVVTGSITYTSGINAYRPNGTNTILAAANGGLASLAYGLAIELAPVRVNVVSPGWVDTPIWADLGMDKEAAFAEMAQRLPARRVGSASDIAAALLSVMRNPFMTAAVLHVDGGHRLV